MIIYSVTVNIEAEILENWVNWMINTHIPEVMATNCFIASHFHQLIFPENEDNSYTFNIQYECESEEILENYRNSFAPALIEKTELLFRGKFDAFRTILDKIATFS